MNTCIPLDPAIPILGIYLIEMHSYDTKESAMTMSIGASYSSPKPEITQMSIINRIYKHWYINTVDTLQQKELINIATLNNMDETTNIVLSKETRYKKSSCCMILFI